MKEQIGDYLEKVITNAERRVMIQLQEEEKEEKEEIRDEIEAKKEALAKQAKMSVSVGSGEV